MSKIVKTFTFEGKRYYVRGNTEREAEEKRIRKKIELEQAVIQESFMPLKDWADVCIDTYKKNQKEITRKKYVSRMNHCVLDHIGDMPLCKIKAMDCQKVLNLQSDNSQRQIDEVYQILNFLFNKAVDNKLIRDNPAAHLVKPNGYRHERRSLTEEEEKYLVPLLSVERYHVFALMYYLGLRPSEAQNMTYEDIEEIDGMKIAHIRGTKTKNAERYIPVPKELLEIIKDGTGFIATATTGKKHSSTSFRKAWLQLIKQMNIDMGCETYKGRLLDKKTADDLVPYVLRHNYATRLVEKVDLRISAYLLGHSSISITNDIYTHVSVQQVCNTFATLDM